MFNKEARFMKSYIRKTLIDVESTSNTLIFRDSSIEVDPTFTFYMPQHTLITKIKVIQAYACYEDGEDFKKEYGVHITLYESDNSSEVSWYDYLYQDRSANPNTHANIIDVDFYSHTSGTASVTIEVTYTTATETMKDIVVKY